MDLLVSRSLDFARGYYDLLSENLPGSTSLSELQILTEIAKADNSDRHIGVTEISQRLLLPRSTVSRTIIEHIVRGTVTDIGHPDDRRRRSLKFTQGSHKMNQEWTESLVKLVDKYFPNTEISRSKNL